MERLTNANHKELGICAYDGNQNPFEVPLTIGELAEYPNMDFSPRKILEEVFDRLAAYEDTGLEPEDIKELCSDDVAKIAKMFRHMIEGGYIDHLEELLQAEKDGRLVVLPCKVTDTVYLTESILKGKKVTGKQVVSALIDHVTIGGTVGKPVFDICSETDNWYMALEPGEFFLTREEAEAALKKREEADNEAD